MTPCVSELDLNKLEEIYLIMEFKSTKVHDVLVHTEKYPVADLDQEVLDALVESMK